MKNQKVPVPLARADARRSREQLLTAATVAFEAAPDPTLKDIAQAAGVGIATLYRHFPTRESLVEAVYEAELSGLCTAAAEIVERLSPEAALREWLDQYRRFVATKNGMADTLQGLVATGSVTRSATTGRLTQAVELILQAGVDASVFRDDVSAADVTAALAASMLVSDPESWRQATGRASTLLELLVDGLTIIR